MCILPIDILGLVRYNGDSKQNAFERMIYYMKSKVKLSSIYGYMKSKDYLNSIYGLDSPASIHKDCEAYVKHMTEEDKNKILQYAIEFGYVDTDIINEQVGETK